MLTDETPYEPRPRERRDDEPAMDSRVADAQTSHKTLDKSQEDERDDCTMTGRAISGFGGGGYTYSLKKL